MQTRTANAEWKGNLAEGTGALSTESGVLSNVGYSFGSRFESGPGTNPEELIAAAHAGCFAMAFANELASAGHTPERVHVVGKAHLEKTDDGPGLTRIELICEAEVPGIDDDTFQSIAEGARTGCPISKALAAVEIDLEATLLR